MVLFGDPNDVCSLNNLVFFFYAKIQSSENIPVFTFTKYTEFTRILRCIPTSLIWAIVIINVLLCSINTVEASQKRSQSHCSWSYVVSFYSILQILPYQHFLFRITTHILTGVYEILWDPAFCCHSDATLHFFPQLTPLQPHWHYWWFINVPSTLLPSGLHITCTGKPTVTTLITTATCASIRIPQGCYIYFFSVYLIASNIANNFTMYVFFIYIVPTPTMDRI